MIALQRRASPAAFMGWFAPVLALLLTVISGLLLFRLLGVPMGEGFYAFFIEPISDRYGLSELAVKAAPLVMIGVALSIGFRAGVWNIGAEGQLILGGIFGSAVALYFYEVNSWFVLPLMILAGAVGGALWAGIPALLRTRYNASEILTSLMLTYVATLLLSYLVSGPMRDPDGFNFPESRIFHDAALLPRILDGTRLHAGALLALGIVLAGWLLLSRTLLGFALQVNGSAPRAAEHAGFKGNRLIWYALLSGGAVAGIAGIVEVSGPIGQLLPTISPGYGFTAIIVAFHLGGESAQITLGLPLAVTGVFQGMLLFYLLAADVLINYQLVIRRSTSQATSQATSPGAASS